MKKTDSCNGVVELRKGGREMEGLFRNSSGMIQASLKTLLLEERKIFITGEITADTADRFAEEFIYLKRKDPEKEIQIWIKSPGGSVSDGLSMYDLMSGAGKTVISTIAYGNVFSMAGIIFASGSKGCRYIFSHSKVLLHPSVYNGTIGGDISQLQAKTSMLTEYEKITNELLADKTGHTVKEIEDASSFQHFFNAREAIAWGLADKCVTVDSIM